MITACATTCSSPTGPSTAIGALVGGEIGPEDPLEAMAGALRRCPYDVALVAA